MEHIRRYIEQGSPDHSLERQYPELHQFLAGTLNQDWNIDHPSVDAAIADGISVFHRSDLPAIARELRAFLGEDRDEAELTIALWELGSYYIPSASGVSTREWLEQLLARVQQQLPE